MWDPAVAPTTSDTPSLVMAYKPHTTHLNSLLFSIFLSIASAGGSDQMKPENCERLRSFRLNVSVLSADSVLLTWNNTDQYPTLEAVFSFVGKR